MKHDLVNKRMAKHCMMLLLLSYWSQKRWHRMSKALIRLSRTISSIRGKSNIIISSSQGLFKGRFHQHMLVVAFLDEKHILVQDVWKTVFCEMICKTLSRDKY